MLKFQIMFQIINRQQTQQRSPSSYDSQYKIFFNTHWTLRCPYSYVILGVMVKTSAMPNRIIPLVLNLAYANKLGGGKQVFNPLHQSKSRDPVRNLPINLKVKELDIRLNAQYTGHA